MTGIDKNYKVPEFDVPLSNNISSADMAEKLSEDERDKKYIKHTNRIHEPIAITRVNSRATFKLNLDKKSKTWVARTFVPEHSHELAANFKTQFLRSYRMVKDFDNALPNSMKTVGHLAQLKSEIKELSVSNEGDRDRPFSVEKKTRIVKNPLVVKTKGAISTNVNKGVNIRKCGYYEQDEHAAHKC
ncbi:hypothetical protein WN944_018669 [Citrus x changshan-huyou]|uniref:Protein FAR1-RELATED SEQUENCE n=1 Tax=Citrus x changshan-huyou TaxID=2935761 RepID=A0AAP0QDD6_9ROSI